MHKTPSSLDTCEISPVRGNNKHHATPHRTRRKTSRREQCIDVHTSSTPTQSPAALPNRSLNSPSSSFPYSQEQDVIWDYTSPKLPRGGRKKDIKLTVKELLENLNQSQVPESNTQSGQYIKLLENYMAKQQEPTNVKKPERNIRKTKKQSHAFEELKKFLETIPMRQKKDTESNSRQSEDAVKGNSDAGNNSILNISAKSFLEDGSECDSTEELWGDADYSFIIRATQELESKNTITSQDVPSTIPETCNSPRTPVRRSSNRPPKEQTNLDTEAYSDLLEQLTNVDWDSVDYDEWDNGFVEEDALSMVPDEVLNGDADKTEVVPENTYSGDTVIYSFKGSVAVDVCENDVRSGELYNSFEDESFEDESLLCQPDVLSKIDEVESMMSQLPKCTPEEIEKKKDEAIKRRKKRP